MSSRQEEKERRKAERMAQEAQAKAAADRAQRLRVVGGAIAALVILGAVVALVLSSSGGKDAGSKAKSDAGKGAPIPAQKIGDLTAAAKAAGCELHTYPVDGRSHTTATVKYKTNPPTSGNHNPTPAADGVYDPGSEPAKENFVHSLEHGRVEFQYKPGTPPRRISQLATLFNEKSYHVLLFRNPTNMPFQVAATAWSQLIGCPAFNDRVFDALRAFRNKYTDKGPEFIR